MKPRYWDDNAAWGTRYEETLLDYAAKKFKEVSKK